MPIVKGNCPICGEYTEYTFPCHVLKKLPRRETCDKLIKKKQRRERYEKIKIKY